MADTDRYRGIQIDPSRDNLLSLQGKDTLRDRYLYGDENFQELFARVSAYYADNDDHAARLYDYNSKLWFMPATPILSNGGTNRGLPISCYLGEVPDKLEGIWDSYRESMRLAALGGGLGLYWGNLRSMGERVGQSGETSGVMPFLKILDSQVLGVSQGSLRRGSAAAYMHIDHAEVEEFLQMRKPAGGDPNRKCLNLHHGLVITDEFMEAVAKRSMWRFRSPKTGEYVKTKNGEYKEVSAFDLYAKILDMRMETGEPYLLHIDTVNRAVPEHHRRDNLFVKTSNLCVEITLPTSVDRTAVCCLSSLNLSKYMEWRDHPTFVEDVFRFLDNVLDDFIEKASAWPEMHKAVASAKNERSVGLGVMGWHALLQQLNIPLESDEARMWNKMIFGNIKKAADSASKKLAEEKGACPDAAKHGIMERFSYKTALAPTASISTITGNTSPSIEPWAGNAYTSKTLSGTFLVKNDVLERLLESRGHNTALVWQSIVSNDGSVQHLDFLTEREKAVFKTAYEIDQMWIIRHAADRAPLIDQAASNNLFFAPDVHKTDLLRVHSEAWKLGVKSLYYCRSLQLKSAHSVNNKVERQRIELDAEIPSASTVIEDQYAVCEACQ